VYTIGSLGNTLTWGDQHIPELADEVADIHVIAYDQKRKAIFQRITKKRRITLDRSILVTIEENLIKTEHTITSERIDVGMAISDATLDRAKRDGRHPERTRTFVPHGRVLSGHHTIRCVPKE